MQNRCTVSHDRNNSENKVVLSVIGTIITSGNRKMEKVCNADTRYCTICELNRLEKSFALIIKTQWYYYANK